MLNALTVFIRSHSGRRRAKNEAEREVSVTETDSIKADWLELEAILKRCAGCHGCSEELPRVRAEGRVRGEKNAAPDDLGSGCNEG